MIGNIIIVLFLLGAVIAYFYNNLVKLRTSSEEALSGIDVQLKRRYDLIPNLIETVKGYAKHEELTLEKVVEARSLAMGVASNDVMAKAQAENGLTATLKSLFALAEAYPDLKANQNFLELQNSLSEIEDAIQNSRRYYNAVVKDYNVQCEVFPSVFVAKFFKFNKKDFFNIDDQERENVKVDFGTMN